MTRGAAPSLTKEEEANVNVACNVSDNPLSSNRNVKSNVVVKQVPEEGDVTTAGRVSSA